MTDHTSEIERTIEYIDGLIEATRKDIALAINARINQCLMDIGKLLDEKAGIMGADRYDELLDAVGDECLGLDIPLLKKDLEMCRSISRNYPDLCECRPEEMLAWQHYRILSQIEDKDARRWFEALELEQMWSMAELRHRVEDDDCDIQQDADPPEGALIAENWYEFIHLPLTIYFLGLRSDIIQTWDDTDLICDAIVDSILDDRKGYELSGRSCTVEAEIAIHLFDLLFFNESINCYMLVKFVRYIPDRDDILMFQDCIDNFDRYRESKGFGPSFGYLVGHDGKDYFISLVYNPVHKDLVLGTYSDRFLDTTKLINHIMRITWEGFEGYVCDL